MYLKLYLAVHGNTLLQEQNITEHIGHNLREVVFYGHSSGTGRHSDEFRDEV